MKKKRKKVSYVSQVGMSLAFSNGYVLALENLKEQMDILLESDDLSNKEKNLIEVVQLNILKLIIDEQIDLKNDLDDLKSDKKVSVFKKIFRKKKTGNVRPDQETTLPALNEK